MPLDASSATGLVSPLVSGPTGVESYLHCWGVPSVVFDRLPRSRGRVYSDGTCGPATHWYCCAVAALGRQTQMCLFPRLGCTRPPPRVSLRTRADLCPVHLCGRTRGPPQTSPVDPQGQVSVLDFLCMCTDVGPLEHSPFLFDVSSLLSNYFWGYTSYNTYLNFTCIYLFFQCVVSGASDGEPRLPGAPKTVGDVTE